MTVQDNVVHQLSHMAIFSNAKHFDLNADKDLDI